MVTLEGDHLPVGRPTRAPVVPRIARQPPLFAPVGVHDVDLVVAGAVAEEDDLPPVGRPGGVRSELGGNSRIASPGSNSLRFPLPSALTTESPTYPPLDLRKAIFDFAAAGKAEPSPPRP